RELGNVVFEMNYAEAVGLGVLPEFRVRHYGLGLLPDERERYERLSREIKDLRSQLEGRGHRGLAFVRWCRSVAKRNPQAARLVGLISDRKVLLYRMRERRNAVARLLADAFLKNPETRAILFHESIDEVMSLFDLLRSRFSVVAEHSEFPDEVRAESLRLFRSGDARIILSARSLIEGFNVPSADLGIIVAASSSVRQRVQTLGRLLRRHKEGDVEKQPTLCVLYARNTVDELIYEKAHWDDFVGAERNEYFVWPSVETSEPESRSDPPRKPLPSEGEVDTDLLSPGQPYPGNPDEGTEYSIDLQGTVRRDSEQLVEPHAELQKILRQFLSKGGRFRITPHKRLVIKLEKIRTGWQAVYLGRLESPVEVVRLAPDDEPAKDGYVAGDLYPLRNVRGQSFSVLQRDKRLIARKTAGSVRFVLRSEMIDEPGKRQRLTDLQQHLKQIIAAGSRINKITVTPEGHVVYLISGRAHYAGLAPEGRNGFRFEDDGDQERISS
ncbi:MAG TPA: helicase-related protein, partial [Candidatus Binataceae bacterium]